MLIRSLLAIVLAPLAATGPVLAFRQQEVLADARVLNDAESSRD